MYQETQKNCRNNYIHLQEYDMQCMYVNVNMNKQILLLKDNIFTIFKIHKNQNKNIISRHEKRNNKMENTKISKRISM